MKLYFLPGACSLSPHIALREAGIPFELVRVQRGEKKTAEGKDFSAINPKGMVPALALDDGAVLTEGPAIVQFVADLAPASKLAPAAGTFARYRLQETLNFLSAELHKSFSPLFNPKVSDDAKALFRDQVAARLDLLAERLVTGPYLFGEGFTVADGYLFTMLNWTTHVGIDLARWPALQAFRARVAERPAVIAAMEAEGLRR